MTIKIQINGKEVELTESEARRIHAELNPLFSSLTIGPYFPTPNTIYPNQINPLPPYEPCEPYRVFMCRSGR